MSGMKLVDGAFVPLSRDEKGAQVAARNDPDNIALWEWQKLQELIAYSASKRWQIETGGINTSVGVPIMTDGEAQRKIGQLRVRTSSYSEVPVPFQFKATDGWHSLDAAQIATIDQEMFAHVYHCYDVESQVRSLIDAGTITTIEEIDQFYAQNP
jgi:hypothetical protein